MPAHGELTRFVVRGPLLIMLIPSAALAETWAGMAREVRSAAGMRVLVTLVGCHLRNP
jgi:hypothetical protein